MTITTSDFATVETSWRENLWAGRQSPIEPTSAMNSSAEIDLSVLRFSKKTEPRFWILKNDGQQVLGTISMQKTGAREYRMRGVWVDDGLRGLGKGRKLIEALLEEAKIRGAQAVWGIARKSQTGFYQKLGFRLGKEVTGFEFGPHVLIVFDFPKSNLRTRVAQFFRREAGLHK